MKFKGVEFIEVAPGTTRRDRAAERIVQKYFPDCGPVTVYRTTDGQLGFQANIPIIPGDKSRIEKMYTELNRALGERRGRPRGEPTVQTKLNLPAKIYNALKAAARKSGSSMSRLVADYVRANLL